MEAFSNVHQAPIKALKCKVSVKFVLQATIVQTMVLPHLKLVLRRNTARRVHPFQRLALMALMQRMVNILRRWSNIVFPAKPESIAREVNIQTTTDAMLGTSAELELLFQMIRICYVLQVSTVKKEV